MSPSPPADGCSASSRTPAEQPDAPSLHGASPSLLALRRSPRSRPLPAQRVQQKERWVPMLSCRLLTPRFQHRCESIYTPADLCLEDRYLFQLLLLLEDLLLHEIDLVLFSNQRLFSSSQPLLQLVQHLLLHHLGLQDLRAMIKYVWLSFHNIYTLIAALCWVYRQDLITCYINRPLSSSCPL